MTSKNQKKIIQKIEPDGNKQDSKFIESKDEIELDSILDNKMVNFDNKLQMSMFFIAYKSIDALYKELLKSSNYIIQDEIIKRVVLETIPDLIKNYNSNLRKRFRNNGNISKNCVDDTICLGRKIDNTQCTRKKYNNNDFCKYHINKLCNGRVDIPLKPSINDSTRLEQEFQHKHIINTNYKEKENPKDIEIKEQENQKNIEIKEQVNSKDIEITQNIPELVIDNENKLNYSKSIQKSKRGRKPKIQFDPRQYDNEYITLWEDIVEGEKVLIDNSNNIYTYNLEHPVYIGKKDITVKLGIRQIIDSLATKSNSK